MAYYVTDLTDDEKARFMASLPGRILTPVEKTAEGEYKEVKEEEKGKSYTVVLTEEQMSTIKRYVPGVEFKETT